MPLLYNASVSYQESSDCFSGASSHRSLQCSLRLAQTPQHFPALPRGRTFCWWLGQWILQNGPTILFCIMPWDFRGVPTLPHIIPRPHTPQYGHKYFGQCHQGVQPNLICGRTLSRHSHYWAGILAHCWAQRAHLWAQPSWFLLIFCILVRIYSTIINMYMKHPKVWYLFNKICLHFRKKYTFGLPMHPWKGQ